MSKSKKYSYKITQESASSWNASIIRQVSSTKSSVSKKQSDFATENDAKAWAEAELETFRQAQAKRNSRKNAQRKATQSQREERSSRKAAKTAAAKAQKLEDENTSTTEVWAKKLTDSEAVSIDNTPPNTDENQSS